MKKYLRIALLISVLVFLIIAVVGLVYLEFSPSDQKAASISCADKKAIGLLDVTCAPYNADPTCVKDATSAIQKAIDDAYTQNLVAFFPPGKYCVSDSIEGRKLYTKHGVGISKGHDLVGSSKGERPQIILKANSSGFGNTSSLKPVLWLHTVCAANIYPEGCDSGLNNTIGSEMPASGFMSTIRNIDFKIEQGNPGAVAIAQWGAQNNTLMNVTINMESGFAGFSGMVGDNSVITNLEVNGGKHGITTKFGGSRNVRWPVVTNLRLYNQTDAAITDFGITNWQFAGLHIKKQSAPAIVTTHNGSNEQNFTIIDGKIEFTQPNSEPAIDNAKNKSLALINVYFKNSNTLVKSPTSTLSSKSINSWNHVKIYGHAGVNGINLTNGSKSTNDYSLPVETSDPSADILSRHALDDHEYPTPDVILERISSGDKTVANVLDHGVNSSSTAVDNSSKIQALIDSGVKIIFFPKGTFAVGKTLELGEHTHLMGLSNQDTIITMTDSWKPTASNPATLIRTKNSATASPRLSFIRTMVKNDLVNGHFSPAIHIQSGRTETVDTMFRTIWAPDGVQYPNTLIKMSGNAGGRFYGIAMGNIANRSKHAQYRHLVIENTVNPIIMYGANPEDQIKPAIGVEITNSKNVAMLGSKQENDNTLLIHNGSDNILALALANYDKTLYKNLENYISTFYPKFHDNKLMFTDSYKGTDTTISSNNNVGIALRGSVDFSKLIFTNNISNPSSTAIPTPTNTPVPSGSTTPTPTATPGPSTTLPVGTAQPSSTLPQGNICGKADADGDGMFKIHDFGEFAKAYGNGKNTCADRNVDYGPCGGRDVNRDGFLNIGDFGTTGTGFAQRYYPKTSCAL